MAAGVKNPAVTYCSSTPRPVSVPAPVLEEPRAETAREVTMGREIDQTEFTRGQRTHYRRELRRNLDLFESFLDTAEFIDEGTVGVELEMNLADRDRKSTRLNSSHVAISYAVFCLKKKTY